MLKFEKFDPGEIVMTRGVGAVIDERPEFHSEIVSLLERYAVCDWGVLGEEDKTMNDDAVKNNDDRILARYKTSRGRDVYIITEWDRSYTTIMFVDEY